MKNNRYYILDNMLPDYIGAIFLKDNNGFTHGMVSINFFDPLKWNVVRCTPFKTTEDQIIDEICIKISTSKTEAMEYLLKSSNTPFKNCIGYNDSEGSFSFDS